MSLFFMPTWAKLERGVASDSGPLEDGGSKSLEEEKSSSSKPPEYNPESKGQTMNKPIPLEQYVKDYSKLYQRPKDQGMVMISKAIKRQFRL